MEPGFPCPEVPLAVAILAVVVVAFVVVATVVAVVLATVVAVVLVAFVVVVVAVAVATVVAVAVATVVDATRPDAWCRRGGRFLVASVVEQRRHDDVVQVVEQQT